MSINLTDGPILLKCEFTRNVTDQTKPGEPININIDHELKTIVSEDLKQAQSIYTVKCDTENSIFLFSIQIGCKFVLEGFKDTKEAHHKASKKGMLILQVTMREYLADLTRKTGQPPLLMPLPELEKGLEEMQKTKTNNKPPIT